MIKAIKNRTSCRAYEEKQVTNEEIDAVVEAGLWAPTGMNRQQVILVAIQDETIVKTLSKLNAKVIGKDVDPFYGAKSVIIVFSDSSVPTYVEDGTLAMGNMLNAAEELGLGSCWIHRAKEVFDSDEGRKLADSWGIPSSYKGIGNCIIGYPKVPGEIKPRKDGRIIKVGY